MVIPLHSHDGHVNAARVEALGVGRAVTGPTVTPSAVGAAMDELFDNAAVTAEVDRLADAIDALPSARQVVTDLEACSRK